MLLWTWISNEQAILSSIYLMVTVTPLCMAMFVGYLINIVPYALSVFRFLSLSFHYIDTVVIGPIPLTLSLIHYVTDLGKLIPFIFRWIGTLFDLARQPDVVSGDLTHQQRVDRLGVTIYGASISIFCPSQRTQDTRGCSHNVSSGNRLAELEWFYVSLQYHDLGCVECFRNFIIPSHSILKNSYDESNSHFRGSGRKFIS